MGWGGGGAEHPWWALEPGEHLGTVAGEPWITVENDATKLGAVKILELQVTESSGGLNLQRQNGYGYHNGQWIRSNKQNDFTHRDH